MCEDKDAEGKHPIPLAYFLTFHTYGTWLHGDEEGSIDHDHNDYGQPLLKKDPDRLRLEQAAMKQASYVLDQPRRDCVLQTIQEVCTYRGWTLLAVHVRSTHVHIVVHAADRPEKVVADFKAYSSRRLTEAGYDERDRKRWATHASTRYLWDTPSTDLAIQYVVHEQGEPMAVFANKQTTIKFE